MTRDGESREVRLRLDIASDDEWAALRGALLAARASELAKVNRRSTRHSLGYGDASGRETMIDEVDQARLRWAMLDRLLAALDESTGGGA